MTAIDDDRCPQLALLEDFEVEINLARADGDMFVIQGDMNMDVTSHTFREYVEKLGLTNPMIDLHGIAGPATYIRGTKQIDCFMVSPEIEVTGCGYLPEIYAVGDHLRIWIDFRTADVLGPNYQQRICPNIYRLQPDNPVEVKKYNKELKRLIIQDKLHILIENQFDIANDSPKDVCPTSLNRMFTLITEHMETASNKCRRILAGEHDWSPCLKRAQAARDFWKLVIQQKKGKRICLRTLRVKRKLTSSEHKCNHHSISIKTAYEYLA